MLPPFWDLRIFLFIRLKISTIFRVLSFLFIHILTDQWIVLYKRIKILGLTNWPLNPGYHGYLHSSLKHPHIAMVVCSRHVLSNFSSSRLFFTFKVSDLRKDLASLYFTRAKSFWEPTEKYFTSFAEILNFLLYRTKSIALCRASYGKHARCAS